MGLVLTLFTLSTYVLTTSKREYDPYLVLTLIAPVWLVVGAFAIIQLVGTWRSANLYCEEHLFRGTSGVWGRGAQIVALGGVVVFAVLFLRFGTPQLIESWEIAFQDDPRIPAYSVRLMRDGAELEVAGGFKYGLARDVESILSEHPQVKVVHLNSPGGRLGEARRLAGLIRSRRLSTYTASECSSACTIAFASGQQRWLKIGAKLGYHASSFAGTESVEGMRDALVEAGVTPAFAIHAASTSSKQMWYPQATELAENGIISGTVDAYRFAASGYGASPRREAFSEILRQSPTLRAIEISAPEVFEKAAGDLQNTYLDGNSEGDLIDKIRSSDIAPYFRTRLATAADRDLTEFAALLADQYEALGKVSSEYCYIYAAKGATTTIVRALPPGLSEREAALMESVLQTQATTSPRAQPLLELSYRRIFSKLNVEFGAEAVNLVASAEKVEAREFDLYCQVATAMFRKIAELPEAAAGEVMRDFFSTEQTTP
jgi:hypothetical protein